MLGALEKDLLTYSLTTTTTTVYGHYTGQPKLAGTRS